MCMQIAFSAKADFRFVAKEKLDAKTGTTYNTYQPTTNLAEHLIKTY